MKFSHIVGIDISKRTFDLALITNQANEHHINHKFTNNLQGYDKFINFLEKKKIAINQVLICLENTGIYHRSLVGYLLGKSCFVWVEHPINIKWSIGLQRGKNDQVDAQRICLYAFRNQDKAQSYQAKEQTIDKIADLLTARERLVKAKKMLIVPIQEMKAVGLSSQAELIANSCQESLVALGKEIKSTELALENLIKEDEKLYANYERVRSVKHVGMIAALQLMVYTHDFNRFDNAKKLASYAGVAPFAYSSGTSIRGKNQVHPMANKTLKKSLHMCALSAIRHAGVLKDYFERKVAEGKNKMSIINAIRNKILHIIFACVREQRMYTCKKTA